MTFWSSKISKEMFLDELKENCVTVDLALPDDKAGIQDNGDSREGRVTKQHENCSGIRSVHQSDSKVDGTSDEDLLTAMDLLSFAWQITRGMVRLKRTAKRQPFLVLLVAWLILVPTYI